MTTRPKTSQQAAYEARADELRRLMNPSPVRLHHEPRWLKSMIRDAMRGKNTRIPSCASVWDMCIRLGINPHFLDHWGSAEKGTVFISEPYLSHYMIHSAAAFASAVGLQLDVSAVSEWNPPRTIRLTFRRLPQGE